jgi:hypothetical protein
MDGRSVWPGVGSGVAAGAVEGGFGGCARWAIGVPVVVINGDCCWITSISWTGRVEGTCSSFVGDSGACVRSEGCCACLPPLPSSPSRSTSTSISPSASRPRLGRTQCLVTPRSFPNTACINI